MTGEHPLLREMTSAAYTVGRDSVAEATAECCQARFFLKRDVHWESCQGKTRSMARTIEEGRSLDSASASAMPIDPRPCQRTRAPLPLAASATTSDQPTQAYIRASARTPKSARAGYDFLHRAGLPRARSLRRKSLPGNARRHRQQSSLSRRRMPPRSFFGGAIPSQFL